MELGVRHLVPILQSEEVQEARVEMEFRYLGFCPTLQHSGFGRFGRLCFWKNGAMLECRWVEVLRFPWIYICFHDFPCLQDLECKSSNFTDDSLLIDGLYGPMKPWGHCVCVECLRQLCMLLGTKFKDPAKSEFFVGVEGWELGFSY